MHILQGSILIFTTIAISLTHFTVESKPIDSTNQNATVQLKEKNGESAKKAKNETALESLNKAENETLNAIHVVADEFDEMTRNTSKAIDKAFGIAEKRAEQLILGPGETVRNTTSIYNESLRPLALAAKELGEIARNASTGALKFAGSAGEYVGEWLAGPEEGSHKAEERYQ